MSRPFASPTPDGVGLTGEVPDLACVREFVSGALHRASTGQTLVISSPAPIVDPIQLLRALPEREAVYWHPPEGAVLAGLGAAREIAVGGSRRCMHLALATAELFSDLEVCAYPDFEPPSPRLFGGLAFAAGIDNGSLWRGFDDGRFVLPRWCYRVRGGRASLSLAVVVRPAVSSTDVAAALRRQALAELETLWQALERSTPVGGPAPPAAGRQSQHLDPKIWNRRVKDIRDLISTGAFQKIVTARTTTVESEQPFDALRMMNRLSMLYPQCTRFLFRRGAATFIGATPETLFAKRGREIQTHALAGSVKVHPDLSAEEAGAALLRSPKNREEHVVVVRQVLEALEPLTQEVEHAEEPRVMQLQNLLHLETPIRARLQPGRHVTALLQALHPTPAVAGLPRFEAVRWIAANEEPRGWYTGPVGWFDAVGDGRFAVAIRCALLERHRAHAFAGAGIMHDSDPPMEYGETAVKLQAMLRALGVET